MEYTCPITGRNVHGNKPNKEPYKCGEICFLTTACLKAKGLPDNSEELTTLREFRDKYVKSLSNGAELIEEYYKIAPGLIKAIDESKTPDEFYDYIFSVIDLCVDLINSDRNEIALAEYIHMIGKVKKALNNSEI